MTGQGGAAGAKYAAQVKEIGFPEFTTKLIIDTFDALVSANLKQQEAYIQLVEALTKSLSTFVNDTKDDVGPEEILALFAQILPPTKPVAGGLPTGLEIGRELSDADVTNLNDALAIEDGAEVINNTVAQKGKITRESYNKLLDAAAMRIAANKYTLLQNMANQGLLRLIVTDGQIETSLHFRAYGSDTSSAHTSKMTRDKLDLGANLSSGPSIAKWIGLSASASYGKMTVETASKHETSTSGMEANIRGGVRINFTTDYLPLAND